MQEMYSLNSPNWQPQKELVRPNWYHSALGATEKRKEIFLVLLSINESKQCQNLSVVLKCLQQCSSTGGWWLAAFRNICSVSGLFKAKHSLFLSPLVPESFRRVKQSNKKQLVEPWLCQAPCQVLHNHHLLNHKYWLIWTFDAHFTDEKTGAQQGKVIFFKISYLEHVNLTEA